MPGFNGTGPLGRGSMTGRGRGYCMVPLNTPWATSGMGYGRGRGPCGLRRMYGQPGFMENQVQPMGKDKKEE